VLRLLMIFCAFSGLLSRSAWGQSSAVSWPPLTRMSTSSLYSERPDTPLQPHLVNRETADTVPRQIRPTHWKEGGLVGALVLGAFGLWFGNEICRNVDDASVSCTGAMIGGGLGGGGIGFLIGALIGGQFPKHSSSEPTEGP
jgi:hypothetical protein